MSKGFIQLKGYAVKLWVIIVLGSVLFFYGSLLAVVVKFWSTP